MAKELEAYKDTMNKWAQRWEAKAGKSSIIAIKRRNFLKKKEISDVTEKSRSQQRRLKERTRSQ